MKAQWDNKLISSFYLWFNHTMLEKGEAFQNTSSYFYSTNQKYNGLYAYACPFNQLVSDSSITGATVMSGVYLNGNFITTGTSGFHGVDFEHGRVYFTGALPAGTKVSGNYAFKEVNIVLTNENEQKLLFETKYNPRPKLGQIPTGLFTNELTYPVVFLTDMNSVNKPFAFGGLDNSVFEMGAIMLMDSKFNLVAMNSLFKDRARTLIPVFEANEFPYNVYGELKSGIYNYTTMASGRSEAFLESSLISSFNPILINRVLDANPNIFFGVIEFELSSQRYPRLG